MYKEKNNQKTKERSMGRVDIIVPALNEGKNAEELINRIDNALTKARIDYNILYIDDRSTDNTISVISRLSKKYPITLLHKKGKKGKAFSILEAVEFSSAEILAIIDADLQYPPEALPEMLKLAKDYGVVVANRKTYESGFLRKFGSRANVFIFGKLLLGLNYDVQSGLKVFRRDIAKHLDSSNITQWTFDMPLLITARDLGHIIGQVDIDFEVRKNGDSKISFFRTAIEIAVAATKLRFKSKKVYYLQPNLEHMLGSGVHYKKKKYLTHSTIPHEKSALITFWPWQKALILLFFIGLVVGVILDAKTTAGIFIGALTIVYFLDVIFSLHLVVKSLRFPPELKFSWEELVLLDNDKLPVYSILCPLFREAKVLPHFIKSIKKLDWPKNKLDVLLLLEEDDLETINKAAELDLPSYVRTVIVPYSNPQTKPKACNYGLSLAKGEYVVVYDAEDEPDHMQLKKAYVGFRQAEDDVVCLQAKLNYYNPHHNFLTKLFTAEYSLWFDLILPGFQSIETAIPLGGTSNHFRTKILRKLHGWDAFNVTEDCDLGARLFKEGYKTAIIDSVTLEEANSNLKNWLRQRSRWLKGYIQTYLVHMRDPIGFAKDHGRHSVLFHHVIGARISFILINPIMWAMTIAYFAFYSYVGQSIEELYPPAIFYMGATALVFGNFFHLYNYMIGSAKRGHWAVIKYVFIMPLYWLLTSVGALIAFYQLIFKPHHWEKTHHGLHLEDGDEDDIDDGSEKAEAIIQQPKGQDSRGIFVKFKGLIKPIFSVGGILVMASVFASLLNFLYSAYLSRVLNIEEFGLISLVGSFLLLVSIPFGSIGLTVSHKTAYYFGKYNIVLKSFWKHIGGKSFLVGILLAILWVASIPYLKEFFNSNTALPFLIFSPVVLFGLFSAVNTGFLSGSQRFEILAIIISVESVIKLLVAIILVNEGYSQWVYASIPVSMTAAFLISYLFAYRVKELKGIAAHDQKLLEFPTKFFGTATIIKFSTLAFLTVDIILVKHFLDPNLAGQYALIALAGKMIFFMGTLSGQFLVPVISKIEGSGSNTKPTFYKLFFVSTISSGLVYLLVGLFGGITAPLLFGENIAPVTGLLPIYGLGVLSFSISNTIVVYHQIKNQFIYPAASFLITTLLIAGITKYHGGLEQVVFVSTSVGVMNLFVVSLLHAFDAQVITITRNLQDFFYLFLPTFKDVAPSQNTRVLIFNWRDTKHKWAGGAEIYLHEISKRLVNDGYEVTLFCGNDQDSPRYEEVDGVKIVRRGGFFMVYIWAPLYYIFKLRKHTDIVIDAENGIPFFTPLFVRKPLIGLVHHVHQEVFRNNLPRPLSSLACFLEGSFMPFVYRNAKMITISDSSKKDMIDLGLSKGKEIEIVHPGVDLGKHRTTQKTLNPTIAYVGRLKPYKSVDTVIRAMKQVTEVYPDAKLIIAGHGESRKYLEELSDKLGLSRAIEFLGFVSDEMKIELLGESWVFVYPSSMEGWGMAAIEANACGTPVVASNVPGLRDSVKNPSTGVLVEHRDVDQFAGAILMVLSEKKIRNDFEEESIRWAKNFSWENSTEKLSKIIKELV